MSDYAGGQGNVEFKESIGLSLVVKFDKWLAGLEQSQKAMNAFGAEATKAAQGLTTTFIVAQTKLEKTAKGITGIFKTIRNDLAKSTALWGTASLAMAQHATTMQRSMFALEKTATATGRSFSAQMKIIEDSIGGVASRAELLSSSVSLMTTSFDPSQMKQFINVVKDTSAALGTDFSANIEHSVAALKTMNPAILANMGVMTSMEELTKKMAMKFPGADPDTLSTQQKQAAMLDLLTEKTKLFTGANKEMSEKGLFAWAEFKENLKDISVLIGKMFIPAWNEVAKVLASVTKSMKNFFENENVQKFGKVMAAIVVPAMLLLLTTFTALVPIIGIFMKLLVVAPFIALALSAKTFIASLMAGVGPAAAFSAALKPLTTLKGPWEALVLTFETLKKSIRSVKAEMDNISTGKVQQLDLPFGGKTGAAIKGRSGELRGYIQEYKTGMTEIGKSMLGIENLKTVFGPAADGIKKMVNASAGLKGLTGAIGNVAMAFGSMTKNIVRGSMDGITAAARLGTTIVSSLGKLAVGAILNLGAAFRVFGTVVSVGLRVAGAAVGAFLKLAIPMLIFGYALEKLIAGLGWLKDKYIESKHGTAELRDEVESLRKEYEALAVAMKKAVPKKEDLSTQHILDYAERNKLRGRDIPDEYLMRTGIKGMDTAGGRQHVRELIDYNVKIKALKEGVSEVSVEFGKFSANVAALSSQSNDAYTKVKLYSEGLRNEEQAYMSMFTKMSRMSEVDREKYIKTEVESKRQGAIDTRVNAERIKNPGIKQDEVEAIKLEVNQMFDEYIKHLKNPQRIAELAKANNERRAALTQFMRGDEFSNNMVQQLSMEAGEIERQRGRVAEEQNKEHRERFQDDLTIMEEGFKNKLEFLKMKLNEEYELYEKSRVRLVGMFEIDQLNKAFVRSAEGVKTFNVGTDAENAKKLNMMKLQSEMNAQGALKKPSDIGGVDIKSFVPDFGKISPALAYVDKILKNMGERKPEVGGTLDSLFSNKITQAAAALNSVGDAIGESKNLEDLNKNLGVARERYDALYGSMKMTMGVQGKGEKFAAQIKGLGDDLTKVIDKATGAVNMEGLSSEIKAISTEIKNVTTAVSPALEKVAASEAKVTGRAAEMQKIVASLPEDWDKVDISVDDVSSSLDKVGDSAEKTKTKLVDLFPVAKLREGGEVIEEIDNKLREINLNKIRFELSTMELSTQKAVAAFEKLRQVWEKLPSDKAIPMMQENLDKMYAHLSSWQEKLKNSQNQLVDNQKAVLSKLRDQAQSVTDYANRMKDAANSIALAEKNIRAVRHSIDQQVDPAATARQAISELRAQQAQSIGDIVGYHQERVRYIKEELKIQGELADKAKAEAEDINSTVEKRIQAAQKEQTIRTGLFQMSAELEKMEPSGGPQKREEQASRIEDIGKLLRDLQKEANAATMAAAKLSMQVEEIKKKTIEEEAKLNKMKFEAEMIALAEEKEMAKVTQAIAQAQFDAISELTKLLAAKLGDPTLAKQYKDTLDAAAKGIKTARTSAAEEKDNTLAALGIDTKQSMTDRMQAMGEQTNKVQALVNLQTEANITLKAIENGLIKGRDERANPENYNVQKAYDAAAERTAEEKRISSTLGSGGKAPKLPEVVVQGMVEKGGKKIYVLSNGAILDEEGLKKFELDKKRAQTQAQGVSPKVLAAENVAAGAVATKPLPPNNEGVGVVERVKKAFVDGAKVVVAGAKAAMQAEGASYLAEHGGSDSDNKVADEIVKKSVEAVKEVVVSAKETTSAAKLTAEEIKDGWRLVAEGMKIKGAGWGKMQPLTAEDKAAAVDKAKRNKKAADIEAASGKEYQDNLAYIKDFEGKTDIEKAADRAKVQEGYNKNKVQRDAEDRAKREAILLAQNKKLNTQPDIAAVTWDKMVAKNNEQFVIPGMTPLNLQPGSMDSNAMVADSNSQLVNVLGRIDANTAAANEYLRSVEGNTKQQLAKENIVNFNAPPNQGLGIASRSTQKTDLMAELYGNTGIVPRWGED